MATSPEVKMWQPRVAMDSTDIATCSRHSYHLAWSKIEKNPESEGEVVVQLARLELEIHPLSTVLPLEINI